MINFSTILTSWYAQNKRDLPWRNTTDPYKIWLSEIILQQTRVAQGMPYYLKFVEHFPTVHHLSNASEEEVLRHWQGLGYYSRGRNLRHSAQYIVHHLNGKFPTTYTDLLKLKGVGSYTAAAIASFAYNEKIAPVDGNVIRVICRFWGIEKDTSESATLKEINQIANQILPVKNVAIHNQAMMEFGALQCIPKNPVCGICPLNKECEAFRKVKANDLPFKSKKIRKRNRYFNYIVIRYKDKVYLKKRGANDIWQGLFEFELLETDIETDTMQLLYQIPFSEFKFLKEVSFKKHILSHQNIFSKFIEIELFEEPKNLRLSTLEEIHQLPKSILVDNYLQKNIFS